jgi:hypothetical protein
MTLVSCSRSSASSGIASACIGLSPETCARRVRAIYDNLYAVSPKAVLLVGSYRVVVLVSVDDG